jgi:uncharacterized protein (UPF0332 family)
MINGDKKKNAQLGIIRAKQAMDDAEANARDARWYVSANRLYFAAFCMVSALLQQNDFLAYTHKGVKQLFGLHFVKTGIVSKEMNKLYDDLLDLRQEGDYDMFYIATADDILPLIEPTKAFINEIERLILGDV